MYFVHTKQIQFAISHQKLFQGYFWKSPIQTIYEGRLLVKAVPSLHYEISRIIGMSSCFKIDQDLEIWYRKVFFSDAECRPHTTRKFRIEISICSEDLDKTNCDNIEDREFMGSGSLEDLGLVLGVHEAENRCYRPQTFFFWRGAVFQDRECVMMFSGCFISDI